MTSIATNKNTKPNGVPAGIKKPKNPNPCFWKPIIVTPIKITVLN